MISVSSSSLVNSPVVSAVLGSHGILETTLVTYSSDKLFPIGEERENSRIEVDCQWADCNKKFSHHDELINHVNEEHINSGKEIEYQCLWKGCNRKGRGFNARYKMLIHVRTHTNERPHKCTNCGKSFSRLENLKIHKRCHTGEKPYVCPVEGCNKAYTNSSDRFKHTRTHFEDKPYVCKWEGCNKRYTDPSSLRKHMKTYSHHSVNLKKGFPPSVARTSHTAKPIIQTLPSNMVILTETSNLISSPLFTISISPLPSSECILSSIVNETSPKKDRRDKCSELNKTKEIELKSSVSDAANHSCNPLDLSTNVNGSEPKTVSS